MRTARLPIDEHMQCLQRRVLAVNHVFEMLLHFTQPQGGDWSAAVAQAMPQRRGATLRDTAAPAAAPSEAVAVDAAPEARVVVEDAARDSGSDMGVRG